MLKRVTFPIFFSLVSALFVPSSFAAPGEGGAGAVIFRFATASAVLLLGQADPANAAGTYCSKLSLVTDSNRCVTGANCVHASLRRDGGACGVWVGVPEDCVPQVGGGKQCILNCQSQSVDEGVKSTCTQIDLTGDLKGQYSAVCTINAPDINDDYTDSFCDSYQKSLCSNQEDNLTKTTLTCNRYDEVWNGCFFQGTLVAAAASANSDEIIPVPMSALKAGDRVVSHFNEKGDTVWTTVDMIPDRNLKALNDFVQLSTNQTKLALTKTHYIPIVDEQGNKKNVQAGDLNVGDRIITKAGIVPVLDVVSIPVGMRDENGIALQGIVHPVTRTGTIVVKHGKQDVWMVSNTHAGLDMPNFLYYLYRLRELAYGKVNGMTPLEKSVLGAFLFEDSSARFRSIKNGN